MKAKILCLFNYSRWSIHLKEWYEFSEISQKRRRKLILFCYIPFVLLGYPIIRLSYEIRLKRQVKQKDNIYTLHSYPDIKFYIPNSKTDMMQSYIFMTDNFHDHNILPKLCKKYIQPNSVILDIGGNIGNHTIYFAKFCKPNAIHTFEPTNKTFRILEKNVKLNELDKDDLVHLYHCGLGSHDTYADVYEVSRKNSGSNQLVENQGGGEVTIITLDSLQLPMVNFIKMDVEGFEYEVLKGAEDTLRRCRPTIFLEIFDGNFSRVDCLLRDMNYQLIKEEFLTERHDYIYEYQEK